MPKALTKHQILGANDRNPVWVDCPEWGGGVYVRGLTAAERSAVMAEAVRNENGAVDVDVSAFFRGDLLVRITAMAAVDEDGKQVFDQGDVAELSTKSPDPMDRIVSAALNRSGMSAAAVGAIDDDLKGPSGGSPSASA